MSELYHDSESCLILISFGGVTESKMDFAHVSSTFVDTYILFQSTEDKLLLNTFYHNSLGISF